MSAKNLEHLEKIKEVVVSSNILEDDEKSDAVKKIEEWVAEDRAFGLLYEELVKLSAKIDPILKEAGLG